jgi:predicted component of type VI protein secretion system
LEKFNSLGISATIFDYYFYRNRDWPFLDFYSERLNQQISNLENLLEQKEESLKGNLEVNEAFRIFSQALNIVEVLKERRSLSFIINKFNQIMPKFLIIKSFAYDGEKQEVKIEASVSNWQDYLRFHKYVADLPYLELKRPNRAQTWGE